MNELHREYGFWKLVRAILALGWRERRSSNRLDDLDNYMRRDIGLPEMRLPVAMRASILGISGRERCAVAPGYAMPGVTADTPFRQAAA